MNNIFENEIKFVRYLMHLLESSGHIVFSINAPDYRAFNIRAGGGRGQQGHNPYVVGSPDICMISGKGDGYAIEVKMPGNKLNQNQEKIKRIFQHYKLANRYLVLYPDNYREILREAELII